VGKFLYAPSDYFFISCDFEGDSFFLMQRGKLVNGKVVNAEKWSTRKGGGAPKIADRRLQTDL
jgi:hypothetical protein